VGEKRIEIGVVADAAFPVKVMDRSNRGRGGEKRKGERGGGPGIKKKSAMSCGQGGRMVTSRRGEGGAGGGGGSRLFLTRGE